MYIEKCCSNCKYCKFESTEIAGVGKFLCKSPKAKFYKHDPIYGNERVFKNCTEIINTDHRNFTPSLIAKFYSWIKSLFK